MVIGEFNGFKGSWTENGQNFELKHTFQRIDETSKRSHTNKLVAKPPCSTVYDTMPYIYVKVLYI